MKYMEMLNTRAPSWRLTPHNNKDPETACERKRWAWSSLPQLSPENSHWESRSETLVHRLPSDKSPRVGSDAELATRRGQEQSRDYVCHLHAHLCPCRTVTEETASPKDHKTIPQEEVQTPHRKVRMDPS